jgi:hypothetical protein
MSAVPTTRFHKRTNFVTRCIAGETIIVPITGCVGDLESVFVLNEVGTLIWGLVDGRADVQQIVETVCRAYDVAPEEAGRDVGDFLASLQAAGVIGHSVAAGS